jgi:hypothetical protein
MGIAYTCDTQRNIAYTVWNGVVRGPEWQQVISQQVADPDWANCTRRLTDQTTLLELVDFDTQAMIGGIDLFNARPGGPVKNRIAIISVTYFKEAYKIGELLDGSGSRTIAFNSPDTACAYLGLEVYPTIHIINTLREALRQHDPQPIGLKVPFEYCCAKEASG